MYAICLTFEGNVFLGVCVCVCVCLCVQYFIPCAYFHPIHTYLNYLTLARDKLTNICPINDKATLDRLEIHV